MAKTAEEKEAEEAERKASQSTEFQEQCFLLSFMDVLVGQKRKEDEKESKKNDLPTSDTNSTLILDGEPFGFINRLTMHRNQRSFFNIETKDLSRLQPMIRLYKVREDAAGVPTEQEITFASHFTTGINPGPHEKGETDLESFLRDKGSRGHGVGLENFTFAYEAQDPWAVQRSISAKLTIFANSFEELLRERKSPDGSAYKYIDLAMKTGKGSSVDLSGMDSKTADQVTENLAKLNFRLKAVVGWATPGGGLKNFGNPTATKDGVSRNDLLDAIYDSYISINLTPTVHRFNVDEYGRVRYEQNYLAYVEDFFNHARFNIFSNPNVAASVLAREATINSLTKDCNADQLNKYKEDNNISDQILADKQESLQTLTTSLLGDPEDPSTRKVRFVSLLYENLAKFNSEGADFAFEDEAVTEYIEGLRAQLGGDLEVAFSGEEDDETELVKKEVMDPKERYNIGFFYVSDLMDIILKGIGDSLKGETFGKALAAQQEELSEFISADLVESEKQKLQKFYKQFQKFRLVLGPVEITNFKMQGSGTNMADVTLGDIPVSIKYFTEWLTNKLLKKEEAVYTITAFTNDFFNQFIKEFLNNDVCFGGKVKQKVRVGQSALVSYGDGEADEITAAIRKYGKGRRLDLEQSPDAPWPLLNVSGERGSPVSNGGLSRQNDFLIYFVSRVQPANLLRGQRKSDEDRGIFHYAIGRDRGIVKTIDFQVTNVPSLKMVRFEQEDYDGLKQLREVYDVNVKSYANVNAFPGSYIYVEPASFSPGSHPSKINLTEIGIGGYHMITRSEHSFGSGRAESQITAKWVAQMYTDDTKTAEKTDVDKPEKGTAEKCGKVLEEEED